MTSPTHGFHADDFAHTANLLRSENDALRDATASNNHNIILAALDMAASGYALPSGEYGERQAFWVIERGDWFHDGRPAYLEDTDRWRSAQYMTWTGDITRAVRWPTQVGAAAVLEKEMHADPALRVRVCEHIIVEHDARPASDFAALADRADKLARDLRTGEEADSAWSLAATAIVGFANGLRQAARAISSLSAENAALQRKCDEHMQERHSFVMGHEKESTGLRAQLAAAREAIDASAKRSAEAFDVMLSILRRGLAEAHADQSGKYHAGMDFVRDLQDEHAALFASLCASAQRSL